MRNGRWVWAAIPVGLAGVLVFAFFYNRVLALYILFGILGISFLCAWLAAAWLNVRGQWVPGYRTTASLKTLFLAVMLIVFIGGFIYALMQHEQHH